MMMKRIFVSILATLLAALSFVGCTSNKAELGTAENPIKFHFLPSVDAKVLEDNTNAFKVFLEKNTPYKYDFSILQSYVAVVESFGTKKADVAIMNSYGYLMANEKYGAQARLVVIRHGETTYQSQFIVKADSPIKKLHDLNGKNVAFVDPSSASGYLLPMKTLKDKNIKPKETIFLMRHDAVVTKVYLGEVDAGATFYVAPDKGVLQDARRLVVTQYPDVEKKVKILELSEPIQNDPVIFRKDMPEEMKKTVIEALMKFIATPEGRKAFDETYGVTELKLTTDADYDSVRKMRAVIEKSTQELLVK